MNWAAIIAQRWLVGVLVVLLCAGASIESGEHCNLIIPDDTKTVVKLGRDASMEFPDAALRILRPLADRGDREAQYNLGQLFYFWYKPTDYREAFKWYLKAAEQGHMDAQLKVNQMYRDGDGVSKDEAAADKWLSKYREQDRAYERARGCDDDADPREWINCHHRTQRERAAQGSAEDEFQLGECYELGFFDKCYEVTSNPFDHTPHPNPQEAIKWYNRAIDHGSNDAAEQLGRMYEVGREVKQDYKKAADLYLSAAKRGDSWAQSVIGDFYDEGKGVRQDPAEAAYWYQRSAEQGDPEAAQDLGLLYFYGHGVPQNGERALYWVGSAACYGLPQAKKVLELIKLHPGGLPTLPPTPEKTNGLGTTVAQDLQTYKACLQQHPDETSKCDALEKAYKEDLELFRTLLGAPR